MMAQPSRRSRLAVLGVVFLIATAVGTLAEVLWNWIGGRSLLPSGAEWARLVFLCALLSLTLFALFRGRSGRPS